MNLKPVRSVGKKIREALIGPDINFNDDINSVTDSNNDNATNLDTINTSGVISGGRKGLEIARTIQNDIYFEAQLNEGIEPEKNKL